MYDSTFFSVFIADQSYQSTLNVMQYPAWFHGSDFRGAAFGGKQYNQHSTGSFVMEKRPDPMSFRSIDEYIASFPGEVQEVLEKVREIIKQAAPGADETISYGIPTFKLKGNLVHFAGYRQHIGFYPTPAGIAQFRDELSGYETSKGAVKFPLDQPIPYELIRRIVAFRTAEAKRI
jgi:uncharacterized protein YdhG (YjbR/CyaY superfamily)